MSILQRVIHIQKEVSPNSIRAFELGIGKTNGYINSMVKNNGVPSATVLSIIISKYPYYNALWLLTGKGPRENYTITENNLHQILHDVIQTTIQPQIHALKYKK